MVPKIEYNGEMLYITKIAEKEKINRVMLKNYYDEVGNIYEAIEICKTIYKKREDNQMKKMQKMERARLRKVLKEAQIDRESFQKCFDELKDENKAVFMAKYLQRRKQKICLRNAEVNLYDMSILTGVRHRNLIVLLNEGMSIDEIKKKYQNQQPAENLKLKSGQTVLSYCVQNKIDFTLFYRAIATYRKKASEAVAQCKSGNNEIPIQWIYERYGDTLENLKIGRHQAIAIIYDLRKRKMTLDEAIEACTIRKNARKIGISDEWGETLYGLVKMRELLGEEFHREIKIDENESKFIEACDDEILELKRRFKESSSPMQKKKQQEDITHD